MLQTPEEATSSPMLLTLRYFSRPLSTHPTSRCYRVEAGCRHVTFPIITPAGTEGGGSQRGGSLAQSVDLSSEGASDAKTAGGRAPPAKETPGPMPNPYMPARRSARMKGRPRPGPDISEDAATPTMPKVDEANLYKQLSVASHDAIIDTMGSKSFVAKLAD